MMTNKMDNIRYKLFELFEFADYIEARCSKRKANELREAIDEVAREINKIEKEIKGGKK